MAGATDLLHVPHLFFVGAVVRSMFEYAGRPLVDSLAFYGAYHQHPINKLIHFVFIPTLLYSFLVYFAHFPLPGATRAPRGGHPLTYATLITVAYAGFYLALDPLGGGLLYGFVLLGMYLKATRLVGDDAAAARKARKAPSWKGTGRPLRIAGVLQLVGWYMQLHPGHAVFEGAKPALLDAFGQSFSVAPLFAFYEGLYAAGFHQELRLKTDSAVTKKRAELCRRGGGGFRFCES